MRTTYSYTKSYTRRKTVVLELFDALIQGLILLAFIVLFSGVLYLLK